MKQTLLSALFLLMGALLALPAYAQPGGKQMYARNYDVNTVETVQGEITEVNYKPGKKNAAMMGVHIMLQTESESIPIHLGPFWYLSEQEKLQKGDRILVTGSRISYDGAPAIVAARVVRDQMTLLLRDEDGFPVWRGWRGGARMNNRP